MVWLDRELSSAVKSSKGYIISGGARGVDQKAHMISLRSGRPTVAFLPAGLACVYPRDFSGWIEPICRAGGAVVSQFSPFSEMRKQNFHHRNRLIAQLAQSVFVAEAARKSGSYLTARLAVDLGKGVGVLPSSPNYVGNLGGLDLLFSGAQLIREARDLLEFWGVRGNSSTG